MLVPQFADHCFIDLFQGDALICRVRRHAGGWTPPPGTWKQVGEQIQYPQGHFCQRAMARLDTVIVTDLAEDRGSTTRRPAPSPMATARQVGLTSVLSAPLYARGVLLGVMSLALSNLTDRTERHYATADRYLIGAIASQVAVAIDQRDNRPGTSARPRRPLINRARNILAIAASETRPGVPTSIHSLRLMREAAGSSGTSAAPPRS